MFKANGSMLLLSWGSEGAKTTNIIFACCPSCGFDSLSEINEYNKAMRRLVRENNLTSMVIDMSLHWPIFVFMDREVNLERAY
jgi:hypothetical protein